MSVSDVNPQYFCPLCDKYVNVGEADLLVVCNSRHDLPKAGEPIAQANIVLRRAYEEESEEIEEICRYFWDETEFHCFGQTFEVAQCVNILALAEEEVAGHLSWKKVKDSLIIVVLNVYPEFQGQGIGRLLIKEAVEQAEKQSCSTVKVATSNDNLAALCLYQKMGFLLSELVVGAVAKHHKGELSGFAGIPIRDELRLERKL